MEQLKPPPSPLKSETARINGAKSRGPKSPEGRAISSRNGFKTGFRTCQTLVLACENPALLRRIEAEYREMYQPATPAEATLVAEMVAARWRIRRVWTVETSLYNQEMSRQTPVTDVPCDSLAQAYRTLVEGGPSLAHASRIEARLQRTHDRAWKHLRELQQLRIKKMNDRTQT
jgi:hypothetical protein